jgi:BirA family biotin operon repressor/biotin-[acetyl-CoA-carboxylase] ligase
MAFDLDRVQARLPGRTVYYHQSIGSTMNEATALALGGCPPGTAVVAGSQTNGLGRLGRSWHSEPDTGLYVSVVLRPDLPGDGLPLITMALGLAAAEAIALSTGVECDLRWPNDLMLGDRKVCGILVQLVDRVVVAGIGINVNHQVFPADLASTASSLSIYAGRTFSREDILVALLSAADRAVFRLLGLGKDAILDEFRRKSSYAHGKRVVVYQESGMIHGVTAGLDPAGFLLLDTNDGRRETIRAGGVRALGA